MANLKELSWESTKNLMVLSKGVEKFVRSSIGYLNSEFPATSLRMKPTFVTEPVIGEARRILNSIFEKPYTMLVVDVCNHGVKLWMVFIRGCRDVDMVIVDKKDANGAFKYAHSAEQFFGFIANKCFEFVKDNTVKELYIAGRTLLCTLIFRHETEFTSLRESKVVKFLRDSHIGGCAGKDVVKILNEQFIKHQRMAIFRIICTNLTNRIIAGSTGLCIHQKMFDVLVFNNLSANLSFFDDRHDINGYVGQKMLINGQFNVFGGFAGSDDNLLMRRFLIKSDFDYNQIHMDETEIMDKITSSYSMCSVINRFLHATNPDLVKQFIWLADPKFITVKDISNLLVYIEEKKELESKLIDIYGYLNEDQRSDLVSLCRDYTQRSAKIIAAFTWGIVRTKNLEAQNRTVVIALDGKMFKEMLGYKGTFKSTLAELQKLDGQKNLNIEFIEASEMCTDFGVAAISRYIGHYEQGKGFTLC